MFYAHLPPIRLAHVAMLAAAALGLLTACGVNPPQSSAAQTPVDAPRIALAPLGSGRSAAVGQVPPPRVLVNPRHPEQYVVQPGDTLWDISELFLLDAWYWPEIWQINPQVANPHLIYPGDILSLAYLVDGQPVLQIERGTAQRLSPRVRAEALEQAVPTIPAEMLRSFLSRQTVLARSQLSRLPYVVAVPEGLLGAAGEDVYVRGADDAVGHLYDIVHLGERLVDPDNNRTLGYEGIYVGRGRVQRAGDPSTVFLTDSTRETRIGDYLLEVEDVAPANYFPRPPSGEIEGRIISVIDGLSLIGQYQVVVLNRGAEHGLEPGHVLRSFKTGERVDDDVKGALFTLKVRLPDEPAGTMMVFQTYERMSYALVMEATSDIRILDTVRNP
jgi:LysM repeat protein